jgi:hypothetical protein
MWAAVVPAQRISAQAAAAVRQRLVLMAQIRLLEMAARVVLRQFRELL